LKTTPFTLPLAVTMSNFSAQSYGDSVVLQWRTESETNSYQWLIERSDDGVTNYSVLARIPAAGSTANPSRTLGRPDGTTRPDLFLPHWRA